MTIKRLAFISILLTYVLIVFGGYVASSNSGMGCGPEWPLCNGDVVPTLKGDTLIEFAHRFIGAVLGGITIWLFFKFIRAKVELTARLVTFFMLVLLIVQVLLGAIVVVRDLPSIMITIHLLVAMLFLASLIWIWSYPGLEENSLQSHSTKERHGPVIKHLNFLFVLLLLTLAFGAYIKHESYGLACGWLGCRQSFLPSTTPELLQTIHRGVAVLSTLYILVLTYWSFVKGWGRGLQRRLVLCSLTVLFQLLVGTIVVLKMIDLPWAVLHLAVATGLFAFVSETRIYLGNRIMKANTTVLSNGKWRNLE
ncbi:COX15/CtaA family protein [Neobacillus sp. OS1-2]|uniref:COX15/CtaA family protein n=1 Tax=Neobacillus sp. OS1-2 TaxID=3070680 RepID=UPI0027DF793D|nr:COX15/CtaA family protein [Neobacillus sp. OS1-2]WML38310.1 COX15/CtaA family protein [Neobacillus sp. OS1-2]